ncbi:MAG: bile acid:sodium symporter family protein [Actinomycetota bacterium]
MALVLGLLLGDKVSWLEYFTMPALAIVMTVSMTQLPLKSIKWRKSLLKPIAWAIFLNYVVFGTVILLLAWLLIEDKQLWYGFVIIAATPPGVAIAPFTGVLSGNTRYSLIGVIGAYFASLVIIPLVGLIFIGGSFIQPVRLVIILIELIIGPFIISQALIKFKLDRFIKRWRGLFVNWGLFIIIFAVIALNREVLFKNLRVVGIVSAIAFITVFGLGFVIEALLKKSRTPKKDRGHLILFATIKNGGFAAATALSLFGSKASLPGAVVSVFLILFLIVLSFRKRAISS